MKQIKDVLKDFNPVEDKYISREFQNFGIYLAEQLGDMKHKALYIKLAKNHPRAILERALSFVKIQDEEKVRNRGKLFMWKLKDLGAFRSKDTDITDVNK
jgi:hypothetical protein